MVDSRLAAVGSRSSWPGKSLSKLVPSLQLSVSPVSDSSSGQAPPGVGPGILSDIVGGASSPPPPRRAGDSTAIHDLLVGLRSLVQRFDVGALASSTPVLAWVPDAGRTVTQVSETLVPVPGQGSVAVVSPGDTVVSGSSVSAPADSAKEASKSTNLVHTLLLSGFH